MTTPKTVEVTGILSAEQIATLKRGYDRAGMNHAALVGVGAPYEPGKPFVELLIGRFFDASRWPPGERELCIIAMLAQQYGGSGAFLAIHLYWGLMEGLSPEKLADALLLMGVYTGISNYNAGIGTLRKVLTLLEGLAAGPNAEEDVKWANVLAKLRAAFG